LFDIDCERPNGKDDMFSYIKYLKYDNLDWGRIKNIFRRLKEWYDDIEKKTEIKGYFIKIIKDNFNTEKSKDEIIIKVYSLNNLHYEKSYQECKTVLLLYNIKLIEKTFPNQRFPFDLYQNPLNQWSIEHIHPQNH
jgi:hypothetical protein